MQLYVIYSSLRVMFATVARVPCSYDRENGLKPLHDMAVGNPGLVACTLSLHRRVVTTREPGL